MAIFGVAIVASLILNSCGKKKDPEKVAKDFYDLINKGEFDKAKELATPTTVEKIEEMQKMNTIEELTPFKIMEIAKKEKYTEGDTVDVNYKVGDSKHILKLTYTDDMFKVLYTESISQIRKVAISSMDLANLNVCSRQYENSKSSKDKLEKLYKGYRFVISDVIISKVIISNGNCFGIAYDKGKNFSPVEGGELSRGGANAWSEGILFRVKYKVVLNGKEVTLLPEPTKPTYKPFQNFSFTLSDMKEVETKRVDCGDHVLFEYTIDKLRKIEGTFEGFEGNEGLPIWDFIDCRIVE